MSSAPSPAAVLNQTPPLADYNLFTTDRVLQEAVRREGAAGAVISPRHSSDSRAPSGRVPSRRGRAIWRRCSSP
jgi:hypothetical protein